MQEDLNAASAAEDLICRCKCHGVGSVLLSNSVPVVGVTHELTGILPCALFCQMLFTVLCYDVTSESLRLHFLYLN